MVERAELRQNPVSGDWVLIAPARAKRPGAIFASDDQSATKDTCPFEDPQKTNAVNPLVWYGASGGKMSAPIGPDWRVQIIPNRFPLVSAHAGICPTPPPEGLRRNMEAVGSHEIVIFREHDLFFPNMTSAQAEIIIHAYQDRSLIHKEEDCVQFVLVFHNHGAAAGATIRHPHSQILALPFVPRDVRRSLVGSREWFARHATCIHCEIIESEMDAGERVIYQNENFIVLCPYAPHTSYEMRIFPLKHNAEFHTITEGERMRLADVLVTVLKKLKNVLGSPAYNFFIHTAPVDHADYRYYHWHVEIFPKTNHLAGVELGSGVRVVGVSPERAANELKNT